MEQYQPDNFIVAIPPSVEMIKSIRKLRWIGLTEEASRLQYAAYDSRRTRQGILAEIPYSTD